MRNFIRALRFAWPYRFRLGASLVCALFAAALWSLNFTAIYPILKIFGSGDNLQTWVDKSIERCEEQIVPLEKQMAKLKADFADAERDPDPEERATKKRHISAKMVKVERELGALHD